MIERFAGDRYISGTTIAQELKLEPIQVRKDLAITCITGKPKKGYPVDGLIRAIESFLGWDSGKDAVLAGAGNLGTALLGYEELRRHGLRLVAAFDKNADKIGKTIHGVKVLSVNCMEEEIRLRRVKIAILTVPSPSAQKTVDVLVSGGIEAIWNFTNTLLNVPDNVVIQKEDLSSGYAMLCVMLKLKGLEGNAS
jgi:redox-sensing transcriptional repressor